MKFIFPKYNYNSDSGFCEIIAIDSFIPNNVVTNDDIINKLSLKLNPKIIEKSTGVIERHIADDSMCDTDLMSLAAEKALKKANLHADELSKIIVNKFFGDRILPMTASFLQSNLKMTKAVHSFDIDGGLHSFFQSLDMVAKMPLSPNEPILVSSGGICNRLVNKNDARHAFLFGDGASAVILSVSDKRHILSSYQLTNPEYSSLSVSMSFKRKFEQKDYIEGGQDVFYDLYSMENWSEAHDFVLEASAKAIDMMLTNENIRKEEIDGIVLGCFNKNMESAVLAGLNINTEKIYSSLSLNGNMMSATLPVTIQNAIQSGAFPKGSKLLFASVGEGISLGFMIYEI